MGISQVKERWGIDGYWYRVWKVFWKKGTAHLKSQMIKQSALKEETRETKRSISCNQNSMALAQKQIYRSMEQIREPRNKPTLLWSINLNKRGKSIQWRKKSIFSKWCWENQTAKCKRMKSEHPLNTRFKNKIKMN